LPIRLSSLWSAKLDISTLVLDFGGSKALTTPLAPLAVRQRKQIEDLRHFFDELNLYHPPPNRPGF
jgi:hypothetical protein